MSSRPLRPILFAVGVAAAALAVAGCTPAGVAVGAGAGAATAAQTEKGLNQSIDDAKLRLQLNAAFFDSDVDLYSAVSFTVEEGRVLLTGRVPTPEARIEAARLAWNVEGVAEVINELAVTDRSSLTDFGRDTWIAAQLRSTVLLDDQIASINYSFDVVNQTIYVMGLGRSSDELARVLSHARNIDYVRGVVNYARTRG